MIRVKIPATSANMGAGFDTLGMALKLYNEITIEETEGETEIKLLGGELDRNYRNNLTYISIIKVYEFFNKEFKGFKIDMSKTNIPLSRGLGSSAACIVGGIVGANALLNEKMTIKDMLKIAVDIEGHPDNVAPALLGGVIISIKDMENIIYSRINVKSQLKYAVMVPDFKVSTELSRKVLPNEYSREDALFNISRCSMLVSALNNGENEKLRYLFEDKIHQPYRKKLINNIDSIFLKAKEYGSLGEFISGSGSTLIAVLEEADENFILKMKTYLDSLKDGWRIFEVENDNNGAVII
ncbi:homoserine kinase [Clostridium acetobutylicum]|uniref:Homoserine kinase n=1 Tax=Clostridium acetobutylicum (strain ATCC 824 / DSM 792 / JCM 1419 / IAM 19013 / LMG 5710 / NBRC 13948 / NRRL B-527 / VKM B-1787 / 2291 / W) TaxID=272562 RepID=KHSE_CLOAB|nr:MULTISPECIES: homoserine kinase [Clostridium]Q97JN8.1 RecName: Full=Homoserine kinase; Short=HK; Short=HSK [Clostridium acetobutylicum ATCC 824]AAK79207.1 Homoserine kinase (thrB) [Clostridium acetobutylicum ATCC 824]ADZ20286.1 Homoserine kinase (thrB) [Clostridium acetobutylicum EA 2018]AWV81544.1 homoserine kinase [Clostridium acetobutylicum]MBC2393183.1 homoserine kinase [Clostridium acetobutylicum]NOV90058.1 homoserine kinase [Clostridium acetobutylicum]